MFYIYRIPFHNTLLPYSILYPKKLFEDVTYSKKILEISFLEAIIWGGVGLTLSGVVQYGLGYYLGSDWVTKRLGDKNERLQRILSRSGVPALFLITVHPLGPQSPMTIVAGAVQFPLTKFVVTMMLASPIRASIYAVLGGAVLEFDLWLIAQITVGCVIVMILPFLHRKTRRLLLGMDA